MNGNYWESRAAFYARKHGINANVFKRQIKQESGFNPNAHSPAGAEGIAQIVPKYHPGVDPMNPNQALDYAAGLDAANLHKYGNWQDTLSIYNSGRGWGTGQKIAETSNYVKSILGGSTFPGGGAHSPVGQSTSMTGGLTASSPDEFRSRVAMTLLNAASHGGQLQPASLLALAATRTNMTAATNTFGNSGPGVSWGEDGAPGKPKPNPGGGSLGGLLWAGKTTKGENSQFLNKVARAAVAAGATEVNVLSGYRSPDHNQAVGGASNSNHTYGHAVDGYALLNNKWVPLGTLSTLDQFGLRSGNTKGFFNGRPDPPHIDDAFNQRRA